jgi:hypothetical protein
MTQNLYKYYAKFNTLLKLNTAHFKGFIIQAYIYIPLILKRLKTAKNSPKKYRQYIPVLYHIKRLEAKK